MKTLVTMPAHNEVGTIGGVIDGILDALPNATIIVVCDRCTDGTSRMAMDKGCTVYRSKLPGLANTFRVEMAMALHHVSDIIVHIDADGQYEPAEIPKLLEQIDRGYNLVLGNRLSYMPDGMPPSKYIPNKLGALGYSVMLNRQLPDVTTGFRVFTPGVAELPIKSKYTYTQEQVWRAIKAGYNVKSVPMSFYPRADGKSRLISSPLNYIIRSASDFRRFAL